MLNDNGQCNSTHDTVEEVDGSEGLSGTQSCLSKGRKKFRRKSLLKNRNEGSGSLERPKKRPRENNDMFGLDRLIGILSDNGDSVSSDGDVNVEAEEVFLTPDLNRRAPA
ncbi:hypothetical protein Hanom_Chr13g01232041 [Helianthus anomalus]